VSVITPVPSSTCNREITPVPSSTGNRERPGRPCVRPESRRRRISCTVHYLHSLPLARLFRPAAALPAEAGRSVPSLKSPRSAQRRPSPTARPVRECAE
jgi:hypothetical protein